MDLIEKTFKYRSEERQVFFRELTAGEQVRLTAGATSTVRDGVSELVLDFAAEGERGHRLVQMTLCDENGKPVYTSLNKLNDEPASKVAKLVALAREASAEFGQRAIDEGEG